MFIEAIELSVAPGPHEPGVFSPRGQAKLQRFLARLRVDGTCVEAVTFRSADGSGLTGVFVIPPAQPPGPRRLAGDSITPPAGRQRGCHSPRRRLWGPGGPAQPGPG